MATLYIRNVPDDVAARLREEAEREGLSLNALAVRELSAFARRPTNAEILRGRPSFPVTPEEIVADIHAGREERAQQIDDAVNDALGR